LFSLDRLSGTLIRTIFPSLSDITGIAYDGSELWLCSKTQVDILKINLLNGEVQKRLNLPTAWRSMV
jgi:hypothetical protein